MYTCTIFKHNNMEVAHWNFTSTIKPRFGDHWFITYFAIYFLPIKTRWFFFPILHEPLTKGQNHFKNRSIKNYIFSRGKLASPFFFANDWCQRLIFAFDLHCVKGREGHQYNAIKNTFNVFLYYYLKINQKFHNSIL